MRLNSRVLLACITGALLLALVSMRLPVTRGGSWGSDRFLAAPKLNRTTGTNPELLEELNETKFMLTYEVIREESIQAANSRYSVILKGTNYTYPFVMDCNILSGGFFTKDAQEQKSKLVVLNEWAAFEIFGSMNIIGNEIPINGSSYLVTGVIDDGDSENKNLYLPIAHMNAFPNTFISVLNEKNGISAAYIQNEYKQLGVTEDNYDFINLDTLLRRLEEKVFAALGLTAVAILLLMLKRCLRQWKLGRKDKSTQAMVTASAKGIIFGSAAVWISALCVESFIRWGDSWNILGAYSGDCFLEQLRFMQGKELYSNIFLFAFITSLGLLSFIAFIKNSGN